MPSFAFVVFLSALFVGSFAQAVKGTQPPYDLANRDTRAVRKGRFDGKVCLVTGGTSGLGADAAVHLAAEGCKTVLTGRRAAMGDRVVKLITDAGGEATFVQADVSKEEDCKKMVDTTVAKYEYGALNIRVNNINPGFPKSEMADAGLGAPPLIELIGRFHPGNRWVKPEEISSGVAWLMSDDSSYTSGINLEISGGISTGFIPPSFQNEAFAKAMAEMGSGSGKPDEL